MENTSLNLNSTRSDKFSLILSEIPSLPYIRKLGETQLEKNLEAQEGYTDFMLGLSSVELPGMSHTEEKVGGQFSPVSIEASTVEFDNLTTEIKVDADWFTYKVIYAWMNLIKNPFGYNIGTINELETSLFVDGKVLVRDNMTDSPFLEFNFTDLRPITLPALSFDYKTDEEMTLSVTWGFSTFELMDGSGNPILVT